MTGFDKPQDTWNERYAGDEYLFGEAPNAFVERHAMRFLRPGQSVLCVADGEGRNSVWLAERGLRVTAFDFAPNAVRKAQALASRRGVKVDHRVDGIETWRFDPAGFDAVVAVFIQFLAPDEREGAFRRMQGAVRPGGHFLMEGYTPAQLRHGTGGPGKVEHLYTRDWVERTFAGWEILLLDDYEAVLHEGSRHVGMSALVDLVARKAG